MPWSRADTSSRVGYSPSPIQTALKMSEIAASAFNETCVPPISRKSPGYRDLMCLATWAMKGYWDETAVRQTRSGEKRPNR